MNIYVRRNTVEQFWEMCLETDRTLWMPIIDRETDEFAERIEAEMVKRDAALLWRIDTSNWSVLMAPPKRQLTFLLNCDIIIIESQKRG